jgi:GAF domain-containing protein
MPVGAEVALAFVSAAASFTVVALALTATDSDSLAVILGVVALAGILAIAHFWGPAYAIPVAIAALVAYDWYQFPPTHPGGVPDRNNLLSLLAYFAVGAFAGEIAAYAVRGAKASETSRRELAGEQAALRRVATLVANNASEETVFRAIATETAQLLHADQFWVIRYESDQSAIVVASSREHDLVPVGSRQKLGGSNLATRIKETGSAARIDDVDRITGPIGDSARALGLRGVVGAPIIVAGEIWGVILAGSTSDHALPAESVRRLTQFTDLFATAIANAESHAKADTLAGEQLALRRVATLVAKEAAPGAIFAKVAEEASHLLRADCALIRSSSDGSATVVAASGGGVSAAFPVGTAISLEGDGVTETVLREGRSHRIDAYSATADPVAEGAHERGISSAVGCPINAGERTWGAIVVATFGEADPCPPETETRLAQFADLVTTAIANAEAREARARLADEQIALRRLAMLVADGIEPMDLFEAVTQEVEHLFREVEPSLVPSIIRFDPGSEFVLVGTAKPQYNLPLGSRWEPKELYVSTRVYRSGASGRVDKADLDELGGPDAELLYEQGFLYQVGSPIIVEGQPWGALTMNSSNPLPPDMGERLEKFTELVATAIANADARTEVVRLADEQAALRRVATLVAQEAPQTDVFAAIADECGQLFGTEDIGMVRFDAGSQLALASSGMFRHAFPVGSRLPLGGDNVASRVFETGAATRVDDYAATTGVIAETARAVNIHSAVGCPIVIEGAPWGAMIIGTAAEDPLPPDTEARLAKLTDLMATALSNAAARAEVERLADEQAALRRVAELVAREAPPAEVFAKVAEEVANVVGPADCSVFRDEGDGTTTIVAVSGEIMSSTVRVGMRFPIEATGVVATVIRDGRPYRVDDTEASMGPIAERARQAGVRSAVCCPVVVRGRVWGVLGAGRYETGAFPPNTETRLERFAELTATAIGNAEARAEIERLAEEQAALRRVATLVAAGATPSEVFSAVVEEVGRQLGVDRAFMSRFDRPDKVTALAAWDATGAPPAVELPREFPAGPLSNMILASGGPVRLEPYPGHPAADVLEGGFRSAVSTPVQVEGRLWGFITVARMGEEGPPAETEIRLRDFTELVATAVENAESREGIEQLADEQAALRRVATLVAEGASPTVVFDAVTAEMSSVCESAGVLLSRYEGAGEITYVAHRGPGASLVPVGTRLPHEPESVSGKVRRTRAPARMDDYSASHGAMGDVARTLGIRTAVGAPIVVEGDLWGVAIAYWRTDRLPRADTEERMAKFAQLLETAIANADSRDQLTASRARLLTAADDARRRVVRDLHDGAQQRLVHSILSMRLAKGALGRDAAEAGGLLDEALQQAEQGNLELRELAHGILPSVLTRGGLRAGVDTVVARLDLPVVVDIPERRFSPEIEASAYFIVAEALTNIVKHARAGSARVTASVDGGKLHLEVRDDGNGGADPAGHGLMGLVDRATALGGRLDVLSPPDGGTRLTASLPLSPGEPERGAESGDDRAGQRDGRERVEEAGLEEAGAKPGEHQ